MKEKNCPIDVEKDNTTGTWAGKWLYKDPKAGDWLLTLVNGGASTTGVLYNNMEGIITRFDMKGCQDIGPNRLRCTFTAVMEDEEKYLKFSGNVELTLTTNNLKTAWQESAPAEITWKPGFEKPLKRIGSVRLFPLNFIRTFIN